MALRIRLTGRVGVEGDAGAFDASELPGRQGRVVLAYLALNHHPVERDVLAELVWGESLPRSWERDLSAVVSKLKALLVRVGAEDALLGALGCYELRLPAGSTIDVEDARGYLERAERELRGGDVAAALGSASTAANLARRPFLPGDDGRWFEARRGELRELALQAIDVAIECHRRRGEPAAATRLASAAIEVDPLRERGYATLMRLQLDAGNRAEALRVYERCRALLLDELGVPPGADAEAVHREALLADRADVAAAALPPPVAVALDAGPLVGREPQLAQLRDAWEQARAGAAAVVLVAGDPGIGKSRLCAELARDVEDAAILFGRCDPEPLGAYQPFVEALRRWICDASPSAARAAGGAHAAALGAVLPELAARAGVAAEPVAGDRHALYDAIGALLAGIARQRPVLLLLDDLHAADHSTVTLLRHVARSVRPARVLVLATYRQGEPGPAGPFADLAAELRLDRLADEIRLAGLDAAASAALVAVHAGNRPDADDAGALCARTGGNPLFLVALARAMPAEAGMAPPPGVRDAIGRHVARLPEDARELLATGAVLGHVLDVAVLARVAARDGGAVAAGLEVALSAHLLAEDPDGGLAFAHPLVRETLYDGLSVVRRRELHARAGAAVEAVSPDASEMLAFHFLAAGTDAAKAIRYATAAAQDAIVRLAYEEAITVLDRALEVVPPDDADQRRRLFTLRGTATTGLWHAVHEGRRMRAHPAA